MPPPVVTILFGSLPFVTVFMEGVTPSPVTIKVGILQGLGGFSLLIDNVQHLLIVAFFGFQHKAASIGRFSHGCYDKVGLQDGMLSIGEFHEVVHVHKWHNVSIEKDDSSVLGHVQDLEFLHVDVCKTGRLWLFHVMNMNVKCLKGDGFVLRQLGVVAVRCELHVQANIGLASVLAEDICQQS